MCLNPQWMHPIRQDDGSLSYRFGLGRDALAHPEGILDESTGEYGTAFQVPCGKCFECIQDHKSQWVHRIQDEARLYEHNCLITLTYKDAPEEGVRKRDFQLFMKRLRKAIEPVKCRYYACGEYGSRGRRPHMHAVIFGYDFPDKRFFQYDKKHFKMYRSSLLESLWIEGFSSIVDVSDKTLEYVTKDLQKLLPLEDNRNKPFTLMSLKPGIGIAGASPDWLSGMVYHNGKYKSIPRYYLDKFALVKPDQVRDVRQKRILRAQEHEDENPVVLAERYQKRMQQFKDRFEKLKMS